MRSVPEGLYAVITGSLSRHKDPVYILERVLETRIGIVQMREKDLSMREKYALARIFREKTKNAGKILIINDDVDIALSVGADGVHLGNDDLPLPAARALAPGLIIGKSAHSLEEALAARDEGANYVNVGPVFSTPTKPGMEPVGLELFRRVKEKLGIPVSVMGGINRANLAELRRAGALTIAMVRGITGDNIKEDVNELYRIYDSPGPV